MTAATYRDLFTAVAGTGGALTGLLFVAISVAPRRTLLQGPPVVRQIRAAAALLSFTNALSVSLYGLVPDTNAGYPSAVLGVIGLVFTAAAVRSVLARTTTAAQRRGQLSLFALLIGIFGVELVAGLILIARPDDGRAKQSIGYALVTSLIVGIARAWEMVGQRDTGIAASIAALTGREPFAADEDADDSEPDGH